MGRIAGLGGDGRFRLVVVRVFVLAVFALGVLYLSWRWTSSINWASWWFAVPLVLAESYTFVDTILFGVTMWRLRVRSEPEPLTPAPTVDVFITTYGEPVELVRRSVQAAMAIRHPHRTYVLDDGDRRAMADVAREEGCEYLTRSAAWAGKGRHAKAGNVNNALEQTTGEFILILDSDQIADPAILDRTLGYFADPKVALVQTPQLFYNVPKGDPFGSQARLFYGPIQQGKDGWNAAFFCGSNAVLRREALIQLGITGYVQALEDELRGALNTAVGVLGAAARRAVRGGQPRTARALTELRGAARQGRQDWADGVTAQEVTATFRATVGRVSSQLVVEDVAAIRADLAAMGAVLASQEDGPEEGFDEAAAVESLSARQWSPLGALQVVRRIVDEVDVTRAHEAIPVMPVVTLSVTEDMATSMLLHALGWKSVYHHEVLARGLAPDDLSSALGQRLRWAQGTMQVFLRQNPFRVPGLTLGQRLMYVATMWSYLSGFAAVVFLAGPILFLCFGVSPVHAWSPAFFLHLLPYLLVNQALFMVVGWGKGTWRGQQYSLALFPLWIQAVWTATLNVLFGRPLRFLVTPKERSDSVRRDWRLIKWQLLAMGLLVFSILFAAVRVVLGDHHELAAIGVNVLWAIYDLIVLSVVPEAFLYKPERRSGAVEPVRL